MNDSLMTARKVLLRSMLCIGLAVGLGGGLSGCMGIPENVNAVKGFELDQYLGTWYEIARMDHSFERGMSNVTAQYSLREGGGVTVLNRGYKESKSAWDDATGKAFFVGDTSVGQLKVSFFGPFYGAYNIVALDQEAYQWSLVIGPDTDYMWILSRTAEMDESTLEDILSTARTFGFDTDALIFVKHDRAGASQ